LRGDGTRPGEGLKTETAQQVPFGDLARQYRLHASDYDTAVQRVLQRGWFVLGEEGRAFEQEFAQYVGAPFCVGCNSGTDAITLALAAHGIAAGDTVMTVANTCVPTVVGICGCGAQVRLCDVHDDCALMDPASLDAQLRCQPCRAVVPVHLYGQAADLDAIAEVANRHGAIVVEDAAQAHGATYKNRRVGAHGNTVAWSFYPSKNLGAFGDGGAVTTHDPAVAERLVKLRNYGQSRRYHHDVKGVNSRLDEIQAALLRARLPRLDSENARRMEIAARYRNAIRTPAIRFISGASGSIGCEHLFPVRSASRDAHLQQLGDHGVQCLIHYPISIHLQQAYLDLGYPRGSFPIAERLADEVLSLPLFPELSDAEVDQVISAVNRLAMTGSETR
jgi:dTDP-4-amino-4,6-dideoxygalactose transaminase